MTTKLKALLATATIAAALATAVNAASARNLSTSNQNIRVVWREFSLTGGIENRCDLTLEGSFHYRTIIKAVLLVGLITRADLNRCSFPTRFLSLPWRVGYGLFRGVYRI
ncbi:MAG TPA: hypothetical protein VGO48_10415 [Conexibacter sp.]|jgi:hypothetical protein|nr:hypothetical protein [Conexibacter sp.]